MQCCSASAHSRDPALCFGQECQAGVALQRLLGGVLWSQT